jgi:hypothetical protein
LRKIDEKFIIPLNPVRKGKALKLILSKEIEFFFAIIVSRGVF